MKHNRWQIILGVVLLALSAIAYGIHYLIFREAHHIFIYLMGDIAFVFIEVLMVTLIIHRVLEGREMRARLEKLNMVIGAFFSEVGTPFLTRVAPFDTEGFTLPPDAVSAPDRQYEYIQETLDGRTYRVDPNGIDWAGLSVLLSEKRGFMLGLLQNQNLLEHESFTDVLWGIFHLSEELESREDFADLPQNDLVHLCGDVERAYGRTARQWVAYMKHLKEAYPYLFSLALRVNPFNPERTPVIS